MGLLRTLLALSVAIDHFGGIAGYRMGPGSVEVEAFFLISGFYMCFILHERYYAAGIRVFYANRYLRLFPSFALTALATLGVMAATGLAPRFTFSLAEMAAHLRQAEPLLFAYVMIANATMFLQDLSLFLGLDDGRLAFTTDFRTSPVEVYRFLLVPQGWSLGCELLFYLVAPVLLLTTRRIVLAALGSAAVGIAVWHLGLPADPWNHRFFPAILYLFLAGALGWRLWRPLAGLALTRWLGWLGLLVIAGFVLAMSAMPMGDSLKRVTLLVLCAALVPPVFLTFKTVAWDRAIGELSYPIYVSHLLCLMLADWLVAKVAVPMCALVLTLVVSVVLARWVETPLERLRAARIGARPQQGLMAIEEDGQPR